VTFAEQKAIEGFDAYFEGKGYKDDSNVHWLNGWAKAERESRCGHFDQLGRPTPCYG
jgi:hypothetical protein